MEQTKKFLLLISIFTIVAGVAALYRSTQMGTLEYIEHLDETIVTVDGTSYALQEAAIYIGYQELQVEEQAKVYDLKDTNKYWNVRGNDAMIRTAAKKSAMDMLIHDAIFFEMATKEQLELTKEEVIYVENQRIDFWSDLEEVGRERIGIKEKELGEQFYRMALAQKMQQKLADEKGIDYKEYTIGGDSYAELLASHTYEIKEELWERLSFGNIVLDPKR